MRSAQLMTILTTGLVITAVLFGISLLTTTQNSIYGAQDLVDVSDSRHQDIQTWREDIEQWEQAQLEHEVLSATEAQSDLIVQGVDELPNTGVSAQGVYFAILLGLITSFFLAIKQRLAAIKQDIVQHDV